MTSPTVHAGVQLNTGAAPEVTLNVTLFEHAAIGSEELRQLVEASSTVMNVVMEARLLLLDVMFAELLETSQGHPSPLMRSRR